MNSQKIRRTVDIIGQALKFRNPFRKIALDKLLTDTLSQEETTKQLRIIAKAGYREIVETMLNPNIDNSCRNRLINYFCEQLLNDIIKIDKKIANSSDTIHDKKIKFRYLIRISPYVDALSTNKHIVIDKLKSYVDTEIEKLTNEGFRPETKLERIANILSEDPTNGEIILRPFCGRP